MFYISPHLTSYHIISSHFLTSIATLFFLLKHLERSQMLNRAEALKRLKEKLSVIAQDQALSDFNEIKGDLVEASFGMQIR